MKPSDTVQILHFVAPPSTVATEYRLHLDATGRVIRVDSFPDGMEIPYDGITQRGFRWNYKEAVFPGNPYRLFRMIFRSRNLSVLWETAVGRIWGDEHFTKPRTVGQTIDRINKQLEAVGYKGRVRSEDAKRIFLDRPSLMELPEV